jgi:uncharacterized SAM-binding protein YcdF (DUF218 family)
MGLVLASCWVVMVAVPSFRDVRAWIMLPLYVHDKDAAGDLAYVMADGSAYWERLRAASDLYHMHRIPIIYILDQPTSLGYNFVSQRSETITERAIAYLETLGVPKGAIRTVPAPDNALMGSLSEALAVRGLLPKNVDQMVVVTSAPHTRRSRLCFQRSLSSEVQVKTYAASIPLHSDELYAPLWHEYFKLLVYYFLA